MQSDIILLLAEAYKRLSDKSPKFFRVVGWINTIMAIVAGIPTILLWLDVILVPHWAEVVLRVATFAGMYGKLMNALTVSRPVDLPFTEKKQAEQMAK